MNEKYAHINYPAKHYQLAIVMGGFGGLVDEETGELPYIKGRAGRLWEAVRLWKKAIVEKILITGDASSMVDDKGHSTKVQFLQYMKELGIPDSAFVFEQRARNTHENAFYTKELITKLHIADNECLLITSATHMDRCLKCFKKENINPDYYPVTPYKRPDGKIRCGDFYPSWETCAAWNELFNEWIGNIAYSIMSYT